MNLILWQLWLPSDVANAQKLLLANAQATDQGVSTCTGLDATSRSEWKAFYGQVQAFCAIVPVWFFPTGSNQAITTGNLADMLQSYQRELFAWQQKLSGQKCNVVPNDPTLPSAFALDPTAVSALRWTGVAVGALATAYIVGKVTTSLDLFQAASAMRTAQREQRRSLRRVYR